MCTISVNACVCPIRCFSPVDVVLICVYHMCERVCVCVDLGFFPVDAATQNLFVCFHSVDWNLKDMGSKNVTSLDFFCVLPPHVRTTTSADKPSEDLVVE